MAYIFGEITEDKLSYLNHACRFCVNLYWHTSLTKLVDLFTSCVGNVQFRSIYRYWHDIPAISGAERWSPPQPAGWNRIFEWAQASAAHAEGTRKQEWKDWARIQPLQLGPTIWLQSLINQPFHHKCYQTKSSKKSTCKAQSWVWCHWTVQCSVHWFFLELFWRLSKSRCSHLLKPSNSNKTPLSSHTSLYQPHWISKAKEWLQSKALSCTSTQTSKQMNFKSSIVHKLPPWSNASLPKQSRERLLGRQSPSSPRQMTTSSTTEWTVSVVNWISWLGESAQSQQMESHRQKAHWEWEVASMNSKLTTEHCNWLQNRGLVLQQSVMMMTLYHSACFRSHWVSSPHAVQLFCLLKSKTKRYRTRMR